MSDGRRVLEALVGCLQGQPPAECDWLTIIEAANRSLVTPAVAASLRGRAIPTEVAAYLDMILSRNTERNERLKGQLAEIISALSAAGVVVTVLKGAAWLLAAPREAMGERIITDLDLMVTDEDKPLALNSLRQLGYNIESDLSESNYHVLATLQRPHDAAMIDLHRRPPGPVLFHDPEVLRAHCELVSYGGGDVLVPSPTLRALHLIVHDQFQDGDYWLGYIDLRHLHDLAQLACSARGIDFELLRLLMPGRLARHVLDTQLVTLQRLFGVPLPDSLISGRTGVWQFRRRLLQLEFPFLRLSLTTLTVLAEWMNYKAFQRLSTARPLDGSRPCHRPARSREHASRWSHLLVVDRTGKL